MRRAGATAAWFALLAACAPSATVKPSAPVSEAPPTETSGEDPCPEPPESDGSSAEVRQLARVLREARANFLTRVEGREGLLATFYPPQLALLEAVVAAPTAAREQASGWLSANLGRALVELRSPVPLPELDGDLSEVALVEGGRRRHAPLYLTRRQESASFVYRLVFEPPAEGEEQDLFRVELRLGAPDRVAVARWGVSPHNLEALEELPILFGLTRLQELKDARRLALRGEEGAARAAIGELARCAPDLPHLAAFGQALSKGGSDSPRKGAAPPATQPTQDDVEGLATWLRRLRALLAVLAPAARRGLLEQPPLSAAGAVLLRAEGALERKVPLEAQQALFHAERELNKALRQALSPLSPVGKAGPGPALTLAGAREAAGAADAESRAALEERLRVAALGLVPRWVEGHARFTEEERRELRPVLTGRLQDGSEVVAKLGRQLGSGWLHLGLPPVAYQTRFADHGADYWGARVGQARDAAALRAVAEEVLERERRGPSARAALLAWLGWHERQPSAALAGARRERDARSVVTRGAVLGLLGLRGNTSDRALVRDALRDPAQEVADAALSALLAVGDGEALRLVRAWLSGEEAPKQLRGLTLLGRGDAKVTMLRAELGRLVRGAATAPGLIGPLVAALGRGAPRALLALYEEVPAIRAALVAGVSGSPFVPLFERALGADDAALRRQAVAQLAALPKPPRSRLETALADTAASVRLAAHVGLARLGRTASLLALGEGARGSCADRAVVLPVLARSLDAGSRRKLLLDALASGCTTLQPLVWTLVLRHQAEDPALLRAALSRPERTLRVHAALAVLELRRAAEWDLRVHRAETWAPADGERRLEPAERN